jgi:hypothetical protein
LGGSPDRNSHGAAYVNGLRLFAQNIIYGPNSDFQLGPNLLSLPVLRFVAFASKFQAVLPSPGCRLRHPVGDGV